MRAVTMVMLALSCAIRTQGIANNSGPSFTKEPTGLVEFINTLGIHVDCVVKGHPIPSVTWVSVDGSPATNISGIRNVLLNGTLVLHPFRSEQYRPDIHASTYRCIAKNIVGTIISVDVQIRTVLQQAYDVQVYDTYAMEGNTAVFKCHVPTVIKEYIQIVAWIKNDNLLIQSREIEGSADKYAIMSNGVLHIHDVNSGDAGTKYKCKTIHRLTDETQVSSSAGQLFVTEFRGNVRPKILDSESTVSVKQGNVVVLPCVAQGNPTPDIKWYTKTQHGQLKFVTKDSRYISTRTALIIQDAQPTDEAVYSCEAISELGKENTDITLIVTSKITVWTTPKVSMVKLGDIGSFTCQINGQHSTSISWLHNGSPMEKQSGQQLKIHNVQVSDQGMYQCVVKSNEGLLQASSELRLSEIAPKWIETFQEVIVYPGSPVSVQCISTGIPLPTIAWSIDGISINSSSQHTITSTVDQEGKALSELVIRSTLVEDGGLYSCTASNNEGEARHFARINVYGEIHIRNVPTLITVSGDDVSINCPIFGYPWISVQWEKAGKRLPTEVRHRMMGNGSLVIKNVRRSSDNGKFICRVESREQKKVEGFVNLQVMVPPKIVPFEFQDELLREGMRARLQCVVSDGDLPLNVTWLKDGKLLLSEMGVLIRKLDEFSSILTISSIRPGHNGNYTCVVTNKAATVTHTAELSVNVPPKIIPFAFLDDQFYKGMRAHVTCAISQGDLPVTYKWLKDGVAIASELEVVTRKYDAHTESLSIENVSSKHSGNYSCVVQNKAGIASHTAQLSVRVRPKIVPFTVRDVHYEGAPARLVCGLLEGDAPIQFVWLKDDLPINNDETIFIHHIDGLSSILSIGSLTSEHAGNYSCVASNAAGTAIHSANLRVNVAPKIVPFSFQGDHVFQGALARLTCVVYQGDLPLNIYWLKDGTTIPTNLGISIHNIDTYTSIMTIDHVESKHGGNYSCIAQNKAAISSHSANLIVNVPPKIVPFTFQDEHISEGLLARVSCVVSRGDLPIKLIWEKDGSALASGSDGVEIRSFDDHSSILTIVKTSPSNNGQYTCVARNEAGSARHSAQLIVKVPPSWKLQPKDKTVVYGDQTMLHCEAEGFPKPGITWLYEKNVEDGTEVQETLHDTNNIRIFENGTLLIEQTLVENTGYYYCVASNGIGDGLSRIVQVQVYVPPRFEQRMQTLSGQKGKTQKLQCVSNGDTPLSIHWYKDNKKLNDESNRHRVITTSASTGISSEMTITYLTRKDNGTYNCVAKNNHGSDKNTIILMVLEQPDVPKNVKVSHQGSQNISLEWDAPYNGNLPIQAYIIRYFESVDTLKKSTTETGITAISGQQTSSTITGLRPATSYFFKISAENKEGRGPEIEAISAKTLEEAPTGSPLNIQVESTDHETIRVSWKPPYENTWNGKLQGYYIGFKEMDSEESYTFKTLLTADPTADDLSVQIGLNKQHAKYSVVVQAYNNKGKGPLSDPVMVMTSEGAPKEAPNDVRCTTLTSQSIHITWGVPSLDSVNGILKGYKVIYRQFTDWFDEAPERKNMSYSTTTTLQGLDKYTNYSIQVLAFTKSGDGPMSEPVFCKTHDDVPDSAMDVKAVAASSDSVIVSWKSPENRNGVLKSYTIYWSKNDEKKETAYHTVTAQHRFYEVSSLRNAQQYEFWVTASTLVGEGKPSRSVFQAPNGPTVIAKIVSFDDKVVTSWKTDISLMCHAVGIPEPSRKWTVRGKIIENSNRMKVLADGSLSIKEVYEDDAGDYSCQVHNELGDDRITYTVIVLAPPAPPSLEVSTSTSKAIDVNWKVAFNKLAKVKGFTLHTRKDGGEWKEIPLEVDARNYKLKNLECGTRYELYMSAYNKIGIGSPSEIILASTNGSVPNPPTKSDLIEETPNSISLYLNTWKSNGCPILYFAVEYAPKQTKDWTFVSNNVKPEQRRLVIPGLMAATWYSLRMTAHNSAGSAVAEYSFATLSVSGATISPEDIMADSDIKGLIAYLNLYVIVPVCITVVVLLIILAVACIYVKSKKTEERKHKGYRFSTASNELPKDGDNSSLSYMQRSTLSRRTNPSIGEGMEDDPTPYATCHLSSHPPPLPPPNMMRMSQGPPMSPHRFNGNFAQVNNTNPQFLPPPPRNFLLGQGNEETTFIFPRLPEADPTPCIVVASAYANNMDVMKK